MAQPVQDMIYLLNSYLHAVADEIPLEVLEENKTFLEDYNVTQLQEGERADGLQMPFYSPASVFVYGKPPGPIKLFDTGAFYRGIQAVMNPHGVELIGRDEKTEELKARYSDAILGVTEENIERFQLEIFLGQMILKTEQFLLG